MTSTRADARLPVATLLLLLAFAVIVPTCGSTEVARQEWNSDWGPTVPHKSFPGDCSLCHVSERWDVLREDFSFDHAKETGHALEGAHQQAACLRCHNDFGPVREYVSRGCFGCHADVHQARLGNECESCHNQNNWKPGGLVEEHARTRFPLFGTHVAVACELCHVRAPTGDYRGAPLQCEACHAGDLARATSPNHISAGWTNSCERCHTPTVWGGAGFSHAFFPLTGAHAPLDCSRCHPGGVFEGTPRDCYSCHSDDYLAQPSHPGSFPTNCEQCHNTDSWEGAVFRHAFPLRGDHNASCATCHPGSPPAFTCFACHEHSREKMDDKHSEESGYSYNSAACLQCHPTGDE